MDLKPSGQVVFVVSIVMAVLATVAVILRFVAKLRVRQKFAVHDYLALASLLVDYSYTTVTLVGVVKAGGSLVIAELTSFDQITTLIKYMWTTEIHMTVALTVIKAFILLWYWSIFGTDRSFRIGVIAVGITCLLWGTISLFLVIFQCRPIYAAWDLIAAQTAVCLPFGQMILGYEITNIFLDLCIMGLPIRMVMGLQMSTQKKVLVGAVISLGAFVCVTSLLRIIYLYNPDDNQRVDIYRAMLWTSVELGTAIISGCLPTLSPILPKKTIYATLSSWFSSIRSRSARSARTVTKGEPSGGIYRSDESYQYSRGETDSTRWLQIKSAGENYYPSPGAIHADRETMVMSDMEGRQDWRTRVVGSV